MTSNYGGIESFIMNLYRNIDHNKFQFDFINMENQDHQDELFHVLQKYLRKDPVKAKAVDITPLHILELTRKKVRKPVIEEIREL